MSVATFVQSAADFTWLIPVRVFGRTHLVRSPWTKDHVSDGWTLCGTEIPRGAGAQRMRNATTCNACQAASCRGNFRVDYGNGGRL